MIFEDGIHNRRDLILVVLTTLLTFVGFWNSGLILPVLIAGVAGLSWVYFKKDGGIIRVDWTDLLVISLLVIELISFVFSVYRPNSFLSLEKMFFWALFYYTLRYGLKKEFSKNMFCLGLGGYALLLSCGALLTFFFLKANLQVEGWQDASQFKALFSPFSFRNNDWATISLAFLPFPLIAAVLFRSVKFVPLAGLFGFSLMVYSVLISFSRGAYLSLGVFLLVLISGIILLRLVNTKTWISMLLATGCMIAVLTIPIYKPLTTTLAMNKTVSQQRSTKGRLETFRLGWCKVKEHWLTGVGAYNYALSGNTCRNTSEDAGDSIFTNNLYLQILIEKGVIGFIVYALLFLTLFVRYCRNLLRRTDTQSLLINLMLFAGFITYGFRELFFSSFFESNQVMVMVGVYAALSYSSSQESGVRGQGLVISYRWKVLLRYGLVFALLLSAFWLYYKQAQYKKAQKLMNEVVQTKLAGDLQIAIDRTNLMLELASDIAPYHELAGLVSGQVNWKVKKLFSDSIDVDQKRLAASVTHFERAVQLNPNDAGFHFNLACLLYLQNQDLTNISRTHFIKAMETEPNNMEFLIGYGIVAESAGDTLLAYELYGKAIRLDPELLSSEFLEDLGHRKPTLPDVLTKKAILDLRNKLDTGYNTVFAARLGLLYWSTSNFTASKKLFTQVVQDLPDLYRPYYYLGRIAEEEQDSLQALRWYQKSLYLNNRDYLAPLTVGDYYYSQLSSKTNITYSVVRHYKNGLINLLSFPTIHRSLAGLQYKSDFSMRNDLILMNLVPYTRIKVDFKTIALRLAEVYKKMGRPELESYYLKLSSRDLAELNSGDIQ